LTDLRRAALRAALRAYDRPVT